MRGPPACISAACQLPMTSLGESNGGCYIGDKNYLECSSTSKSQTDTLAVGDLRPVDCDSSQHVPQLILVRWLIRQKPATNRALCSLKCAILSNLSFAISEKLMKRIRPMYVFFYFVHVWGVGKMLQVDVCVCRSSIVFRLMILSVGVVRLVLRLPLSYCFV